VFEVFPDEAAARSSIFEASDGTTVTLSVIFEENVSGLAAEAPVEWRGVRIGEVANVTGIVDLDRFGDERVRLLATLDIMPGRFGLTGELSEAEALQFLSERVEEGLRARLVSASILTGGLKVEFLTVEDAPPSFLNLENEPFPLMPVTQSEVADVSATAEGVFQRINALPVEDLMSSAIAFLDNATAFVTSEEFRETPGELRGLLSDVRGVVGSDEIQALPAEIGAVMGDLQLVISDLRGILLAFNEADTVNRLVSAVDKAGAAAEAAEQTLKDVPALIERVNTFVEMASALSLESLVSEATGLAEDARAVIGGEDARALPARLVGAVSELEGVLQGLTQANTADQLTKALAAAETAANAVETAVAGVPEVVARVDAIAANVEQLPLERLADELADVLNTAETLFGDAAEARLPDALAGALSEAQLALAELREGGLIENANQTLAATERAAAAVANAAEDLPAIVARIDSVLGQARTTLAGFDESSTFSREAQQALREVQKAADAVESLARALERRPNSIILGR
jgi:paraquat-inducible protein B